MVCVGYRVLVVRYAGEGDMTDEPDDESLGFCQNCGCNLYPGDDIDYCGQCEWMIEQAAEEYGMKDRP